MLEDFGMGLVVDMLGAGLYRIFLEGRERSCS